MTAGLPRFLQSVRYAWRGVRYAWLTEQNFRLQAAAAVAVLAAAWLLGLPATRIVVLVLAATVVLVLELLNTFFEKLVDLLSPRLHHAVAVLKDLLAAAVLLSSVGAAVVGLLLFWPYL